MKIQIHRGTNQIGGCVCEIESGGYKVFIDFGEQLPCAEKISLHPIEGLTCGDSSKSALFITHYHADHIGKIIEALDDLPIYLGKTALEIYQHYTKRRTYIKDQAESDKNENLLQRSKRITTFEALQKIKVGGITVTPLLVDHSAFDAYMFIIEAEGKRILHTGDFRGHGFRGKALLKTLRAYAQNIDYIISEGSNIQRTKAPEKSEMELQSQFVREFEKNKYNFVFASSTNIDRIFGLYHAAKKSKRSFVCDKYQAEILKIVSKNHKHHSSFYDIDYEQEENPAARFFDLNRQNADKTYYFNKGLESYLNRHGFCMLIRSNPAFKPLLDKYSELDKTQVYFSMWSGYLHSESSGYNSNIADFLRPYNLTHLHTSGHADIDTLKSVFDTINPKVGIIPIHTEAPEMFEKIFPEHNFIVLQDGESYNTNFNN